MSRWMIENWGPSVSTAPLLNAFAAGSPLSLDLNLDEPEAGEYDMCHWRKVVLRMSDSFSTAAVAQPQLAPYLLEAMGHALEQLLLFGREKDLRMLEEWLNEDTSH